MGEQAEVDYLAMLREAVRYCKVVDLKSSPDPEAEMMRLQFIAGLRYSETKLKLLEALIPNNNSTVDELLQLILYGTQAKRFAESSVLQSIPNVVACAKKVAPLVKKNLSRRQKPEQCGRCGRKTFHPIYECPGKDEKRHKCSNADYHWFFSDHFINNI